LFVLDQPRADEGIRGDHINEGIEVGGDGMRAETSVRGASATETIGDGIEAEAKVSAEALTSNATAAPEV
jgi:hypothetical protein